MLILADDTAATLEARLVGRDPVVVKHRAGNAHQAISGATGKLKRAVATVLEKHDPRHDTRVGAVVPDELSE